MNRRTLLQLLAWLAATPAALAWAGPRVLAVRAWPGKASTRVTIESDTELRYLLTTLASPDRAVVDLSDVQADATFQKALDALRSDTGVLARARIGQFRPDTARLVLELKARAEVASFVLPPAGPYRHRLVIDLTPIDADDPIAAFLAKLVERESELERQASVTAARPDKATVPPPPAPPPGAAAPAPTPVPEPPKPAPARVGGRVSKPFVVVLDPGHGGEDPGAIGPGGTYEKDVVLAVAQAARRELEQDPRFVVFMTREEDVFVPLAERVRKARSVNADVFVSIHADAFTRPDVRGSSVFTLSERGATSAAAKWIADKENQSDLIGGVRLAGRDPALAKMLFEIHQSVTNDASLKLGRGLVKALKPVGKMHKGVVEHAGFAVLRAPDVPSALVETAFISNPEEEAKLRSPDYQLKLARAIRIGVRGFAQTTLRRT
ncbi:MAG: N-acetylmuramoyl-L-alanine amidase [Burkholderiales bacterium]|nr:N-acetylmuramoyl-L-alanine amidase [Burkholderiales bacterium]